MRMAHVQRSNETKRAYVQVTAIRDVLMGGGSVEGRHTPNIFKIARSVSQNR